MLSKVRAVFGDDLHLAITGAAPISAEIIEFFDACGVLVLEGYGLTETCAASTLNTADEQRIGTVGRPLPDTEVRVAADGELLLRGPHVFAGYYRNEEATSESLVDGWLLHRRPRLRRRRRLRAHHRAQEGAHHHLERQEHLADQHRGAPAREPLDLAGGRVRRQQALPGRAAHARCRRGRQARRARGRRPPAISPRSSAHPAVRAELQTAVDAVNERLARIEQIKRFAILDRDLSQPDGELTPTLKIKRNVVAERYGDRVEELYA